MVTFPGWDGLSTIWNNNVDEMQQDIIVSSQSNLHLWRHSTMVYGWFILQYIRVCLLIEDIYSSNHAQPFRLKIYIYSITIRLYVIKENSSVVDCVSVYLTMRQRNDKEIMTQLFQYDF